MVMTRFNIISIDSLFTSGLRRSEILKNATFISHLFMNKQNEEGVQSRGHGLFDLVVLGLE